MEICTICFMLKQHGKMQIGGFWANRINSTFSLPLPYLCGRQVRNILLRKIFWYFAETKIMSSMKIHYQQNLANLLDYYINFRRSYPEDRQSFRGCFRIQGIQGHFILGSSSIYNILKEVICAVFMYFILHSDHILLNFQMVGGYFICCFCIQKTK